MKAILVFAKMFILLSFFLFHSCAIVSIPRKHHIGYSGPRLPHDEKCIIIAYPENVSSDKGRVRITRLDDQELPDGATEFIGSVEVLPGEHVIQLKVAIYGEDKNYSARVRHISGIETRSPAIKIEAKPGDFYVIQTELLSNEENLRRYLENKTEDIDWSTIFTITNQATGETVDVVVVE